MFGNSIRDVESIGCMQAGKRMKCALRAGQFDQRASHAVAVAAHRKHRQMTLKSLEPFAPRATYTMYADYLPSRRNAACVR